MADRMWLSNAALPGERTWLREPTRRHSESRTHAPEEIYAVISPFPRPFQRTTITRDMPHSESGPITLLGKEMPPSFPRFLQGFAAAVHLLNVAIEKRAALECVVIQANLIDGLLRTGLVLQAQLIKRSSEIDERFIKQEDGDPMISEREIYRRALAEGVIDQSLFDDLSAAYGQRNKAIHRYLLCSVTYDNAKHLVFSLADLKERVRDRVYLIEQEQIKQGVGMTVTGPDPDREFLKEFAAKKERPYNLG